MNTLRILIVEDDILVAEGIAEELTELGYVISGLVHNSDEAFQSFQKLRPDLVLMDINLKGSSMDGIDLAHEFNKLGRVPLIFLTGIEGKETAMRAQAVKPANYLVKPCNSVQLEISIDLALKNFAAGVEASIEESFQFQTPPLCAVYSGVDHIFIKENSKHYRLEIADIIYIKSDGPGPYVKIVLEDRNIIQSMKLKSFCEQAKHSSLVRINRSYVVNLDKVVGFDRDNVFIIESGQQKEIPIGVTYKHNVRKLFLKLKAD